MAWIYHPKLDRTVEVPDAAVVVWEHSGWRPADPPPRVEEPAQEMTAAAPRRRRSKPATVGETSEE